MQLSPVITNQVLKVGEKAAGSLKTHTQPP
jgi:hypothetical protein